MLWYSLEVPHRGTSNEYPQLKFSWRNKKNIMWILPLIWSYALPSLAFWRKVLAHLMQAQGCLCIFHLLYSFSLSIWLDMSEILLIEPNPQNSKQHSMQIISGTGGRLQYHVLYRYKYNLVHWLCDFWFQYSIRPNAAKAIFWFTIFTLSIGTPYLLTILVLKFENSLFYYLLMCLKSAEWQTV